jgi:hypothetical protein
MALAESPAMLGNNGTTNVREVANPRISRDAMERQVELQQAVSRAKRGSKGWKRRCKALRTFKRHQANRRLDEQHKASAAIASEYFAFSMEKLTVRNMTASAAGTADEPGKNVQQKAGLNREILDTAPARLIPKRQETRSFRSGRNGVNCFLSRGLKAVLRHRNAQTLLSPFARKTARHARAAPSAQGQAHRPTSEDGG